MSARTALFSSDSRVAKKNRDEETPQRKNPAFPRSTPTSILPQRQLGEEVRMARPLAGGRYALQSAAIRICTSIPTMQTVPSVKATVLHGCNFAR
jgi:hypothetical protein